MWSLWWALVWLIRSFWTSSQSMYLQAWEGRCPVCAGGWQGWMLQALTILVQLELDSLGSSLCFTHQKGRSPLDWGVLTHAYLHTHCYSFKKHSWVAVVCQATHQAFSWSKWVPATEAAQSSEWLWEAHLLMCFKGLRNVHSFGTPNSNSGGLSYENHF